MSNENTKVVKSSKRGASKGERRGGREKGTPNKRTLILSEDLGDLAVAKELVALFKQAKDKNDMQMMFQILSTLMKYLYPQRKAVEIDAEATKGINIIVADKEHKQMLEEL